MNRRLYFIYNSNDNHDHSQVDKSSHIMPRISTRRFLCCPRTLCISAVASA
ncbi:hemin ABC transporter substrate-binding protein, partial [Klebsiella pneumoniae]